MTYPHCPSCRSVAIVHRIDGLACLTCGHTWDGDAPPETWFVIVDMRQAFGRIEEHVFDNHEAAMRFSANHGPAAGTPVQRIYHPAVRP